MTRIVSNKPLLIFLIIIMALVVAARFFHMNDLISPGDDLPATITKKLKNSGGIYPFSIVIWFRPGCQACKYQLMVLRRHIDFFQKGRLILVTDSDHIFDPLWRSAWPVLSNNRRVYFMHLEQKVFKKVFGRFATPSIYIFNQENRLIQKYSGEVRPDVLMNAIKKDSGIIKRDK